MDHATARKKRPVVIHEEECDLEGWVDPIRGGVRWRTLFSAGRTDSESMTCGVAEIGVPARGEDFSTHQHAQAEIYYVLSGVGRVVIDGTEYPLRPGTAVFIPRNAIHGAWNTGDEPLRLFYAFAVDSFEEIEYVFPDLLAP